MLCELRECSVFETLNFDERPFKTTLIFPCQSFSSIFITKIQLFLNFHLEREELGWGGAGAAIADGHAL